MNAGRVNDFVIHDGSGRVTNTTGRVGSWKEWPVVNSGGEVSPHDSGTISDIRF